MTTIKQDDSLTNAEKDKQLAKLRAQLDNEETDRQLMFLQSSNHFSKGYITNTAVGMPDRSFRTFNTGQLISVHPSSTLFGKPNMDAIMYIEYVFTTKGYARNVSAIELSWLQEIAPHVIGGVKVNIND